MGFTTTFLHLLSLKVSLAYMILLLRSVFNCDGLLLCSTMDNRLVVWNPFSGETKWIQPNICYKEYDYYALGYDRKSSCYKILRMVKSEYEIYDFASDSWGLVGVNRDWLIKRRQSRGVSVKGNTYWIGFSQHGPCYKPFLLSFDFSAEIFQSLPHPVDDPAYYGLHLSVTREEQKLCMVDVQHGFKAFSLNIWMATMNESTGAMSWTKKFRVLGTDERYRYQLGIGMSFLAYQENKVVLSCTDTGVLKNVTSYALRARIDTYKWIFMAQKLIAH